MSSAILPLESPTAQQPCSIRGSHQRSPRHHRLEVLSEHDVPRFSERPSVAVNAQLGIAISLRAAPVTARTIGLDVVLGPRVHLLLPPIQPFLQPIDLNPRGFPDRPSEAELHPLTILLTSMQYEVKHQRTVTRTCRRGSSDSRSAGAERTFRSFQVSTPSVGPRQAHLSLKPAPTTAASTTPSCWTPRVLRHGAG